MRFVSFSLTLLNLPGNLVFSAIRVKDHIKIILFPSQETLGVNLVLIDQGISVAVGGTVEPTHRMTRL